MSALMDGISSINSLSAQIAKIQSGEQVDPDTIKLALQQSFNDMLTNLVSTSNDDEEDDDSFDPFSLMMNANVPVETVDQGNVSQLESLTQLADNPLALRGYMLDVNKL